MADYPEGYVFIGGYPTPETVQRAYDDADFNRAVQCYRFFYPTVSIMAPGRETSTTEWCRTGCSRCWKARPSNWSSPPNSDTPYAAAALDLTEGPMVVELPPGPLMCTANDLNQRWIMDMGLPGPDGGKGGKHVLCGPGFTGDVPAGHFKGTATTNRVLMLLRALPHGDDMQGAIDLMQSITVHPLDPGAEVPEIDWVDLSKIVGADFTPIRWEDNLTYWEVLHDLIDAELPFAEYRNFYGELASLGIEKDKPFAPDERMRDILTRASQLGNAQLRVQSFADRRLDRDVWPGTTWEWAVLRPENGTFDTETHTDNYARQKWFYQAQIESPAMFKR